MNYRKTLRSATLCSMLFVAIVAECQGQNVSYEIKGIVCEKNKPDISLEDVEVIVSTIGNTNDSLTKLCLTKSDGSYSFNICPNKYRIFLDSLVMFFFKTPWKYIVMSIWGSFQ